MKYRRRRRRRRRGWRPYGESECLVSSGQVRVTLSFSFATTCLLACLAFLPPPKQSPSLCLITSLLHRYYCRSTAPSHLLIRVFLDISLVRTQTLGRLFAGQECGATAQHNTFLNDRGGCHILRSVLLGGVAQTRSDRVTEPHVLKPRRHEKEAAPTLSPFFKYVIEFMYKPLRLLKPYVSYHVHR